MTGVSVLILTLNEELNIVGCIDSCSWSDDIVIFDSMSEDLTRELAAQRGARVVERRFDNYAAQRNAALATVQYKHPWVLMVDADERVSPELAAEIATTIAAATEDMALYRMRRKDFFLGKWLRRSSGYPTWFGRLMRVGRVRVVREINEEFIADGRVGHVKSHLHHFPFNRGIAHWFERHNKYSSMEAIATMNVRNQPIVPSTLFSKDPADRRRMWKRLVYRLPLRPVLIFLYLYILRLGMLDGLAGFYFSRMRATYEMLIDLKVIEGRRRRRGLAV